MQQEARAKSEMIGGTPVPAVVSSQSQGPVVEAVVVTTTETNHAQQGTITTLLGEYLESERNHGRKVFKKKKTREDDLEVLIYYWDNRDGTEFEGWWFGTGVGSAQVWSHCLSSQLTPPRTGWKIPHDGIVCNGLVVSVTAQPGAPARGKEASPLQDAVAARNVSWSSVSFDACKVVREVSALVKEPVVSLETLNAMEDTLKEQAELLAVALQELSEVQADASCSFQEQRMLQTQGIALRTAQTQVRQSLAEVKRVAREMATGADEAKEQATLDEMLPKAQASLDTAIRAVAEAELAANACLEREDVEEADIDVAEALAAQAQQSVTEAITTVNSQQKICRIFVSMKVKQIGMNSLCAAKEGLTKQQQKLGRLKTLRRTLEQRGVLLLLKQEALSYLSPPEAQLEQVKEELHSLRGSGTLRLTGSVYEEAQVSEILSMLNVAETELNYASAYLERKKGTGPAAGKSTIEELIQRANTDKAMLAQIRSEIQAARQTDTKVSFHKEVDEAFMIVEKAMKEYQAHQHPVYEGAEDRPPKETLKLIEASDAASSAAEVACKQALSLVDAKMKEVHRMGASRNPAALASLQEWQTVARDSSKELKGFREDLEMLRRKLRLRQASEEVEHVAELALALELTASILSDDTQVMESSAQQLQSHAEAAMKQEVAASQAFLAARKHLSDLQVYYKNLRSDLVSSGVREDGRDWSKEAIGAALQDLQSQLTAAQSSCARNKRMCESLKSRLVVKGLLEEVERKLVSFEQSLEPMRAAWEKCKTADSKEGEEAEQVVSSSLSSAVADDFEERSRKAKEAFAAIQSSFVRLDKHPNILSSVVLSKRQRMKEAESLLAAMTKHSKEMAESRLLQRMVAEVTTCLDGLEEALGKVHVAEEPFLTGVAHSETASQKLFLALEAAVQEAVDHAKVTRSVLMEQKDLAKQKLEVPALAAQASTALEKLEEQFKSATKSLASVKRAAAGRKGQMLQSTVDDKRRLLREKVADAEVLRRQLAEATATLDTQSVRTLADRAMAAHHELSVVAEEMRQWAEEHQHPEQRTKAAVPTTSSGKDGGGGGGPGSEAAVDAVKLALETLLEEARSAKAAIEQGKTALRDEELRFVAERLKQEAASTVDGVRQKLQEMKSLAALFEQAGLTLARSESHKLTQMVMAVRRYLKATGKTPEGWFEEIVGSSDGLLSQALFIKSIKAALLHDGQAEMSACMPQDFEALFARMTCESRQEGDIAFLHFKHLLEARQLVNSAVLMTDCLEVKASSTLRRLEVNEILETLEEPELDSSAGLMRLYTRAVEDDAKGYVTLKSSVGTVYVVDYDPLLPLESKVAEHRQDLVASIARAQKYFELKISEIKRRGASRILKQSCLEEKAVELKAVVEEHQQFQAAFADAKANRQQRWSEEQKRRRRAEKEVEAGKVAAKVLENSEKLANEISRTSLTASVVLGSGDMGDSETSSVLNASANCEEALEQHLTELAEQLAAHAQCRRSPRLSAAYQTKLEASEAKLAECERQCKLELKHLQKQAQKLSEGSVWQALGSAFKSHKELMFNLFSESDEHGRFRMRPEALRQLLEGAVQSGDALTTTELDLGVPKVASELTLLEALECGQEYVACLCPVTITSSASVTEGKSLRRLEHREVLEVLEKREIHEGVSSAGSSMRFRCRSLQDGQEGWVTSVGNQGKRFLAEIPKPFLICQEECAQLQESMKTTGKPLENGAIEAGAVLELVEGPRTISPPHKQRVKVEAKKDGKMGWVTLEETTGDSNFCIGKFLVCLRDVAITSSFDIVEGKALGKVSAGEALELLSEPQESKEHKLLRAKGRSQRDGKEGWVTLRGSLGSPFAEEFDKCYVCTRSIDLEEYCTSGIKAIREIEVGEAFELVEGPLKEESPSVSRLLARDPFTGVTGALTVTRNITPWSREYLVSAGDVAFHTTDQGERKGGVTYLHVGERVLLDEVPRPGNRIHCKRLKDDTTGHLAWRVQSLSHQAKEGWTPEEGESASFPSGTTKVETGGNSASIINKAKRRRNRAKTKPAPSQQPQAGAREWHSGPAAASSADAHASSPSPSTLDNERRHTTTNTPPSSTRASKRQRDWPGTPGVRGKKSTSAADSLKQEHDSPPQPHAQRNRNPLPTTWQGAPSRVTSGPDHWASTPSSSSGAAGLRAVRPSSSASPGVYKSYHSSAGGNNRPEFRSGATAQRQGPGPGPGKKRNNPNLNKPWRQQPWRR